MTSTTTPSKVKAFVENVEQINNEIEQLRDIAADLEKKFEETFSENEKNLQLQEIIDKIGQLDKSLSYVYFIKHIEDIR